jgi:glycolate oxidase
MNTFARQVHDEDVKATYAVDMSLGAAAPDHFTVVRARDLADVVEVMQHAQATRTPVVPQGARSGLAGGAVALEGAIVLNLEGVSGVTTVDHVEAIATCGAGTITGDLKAAAASAGLFYPPDPASVDFSTVGGNVATNAGGLCCVKYGVTADYVRGLQVVLPGGEVIRTGRRTAKGVAGLDLTGLFVGSEGTLGVVTEVTVRLLPAPDPALTALATFDSLETASTGILALRADRHRPSLVELLDRTTVEAIQALADFGYPVGTEAALIVQSDRVGHAAEDVQRYAGLLAEAGAVEVAIADDEEEADLLLAGRRALNPALEARGPRFIEDVCVPVTRLAELIRAGHRIADRRGVDVTMSGHAGDGNLHPCFFFDPSEEGSRERAELAFGDLIEVTLGLGGTITGEHGVGSLKARWLVQELGAAAVERQRAVKALFDPDGILNPGRVYWP